MAGKPKTATAPHEPHRPAACTPANPGTQVSAPDPAYAVRFQSPVSRTCAFCCSARPLSELAQWGTSLACTDVAACDQRAQAAGIYPMNENELEVAAIEGRQGAIR